jgi:hypothetical protein
MPRNEIECRENRHRDVFRRIQLRDATTKYLQSVAGLPQNTLVQLHPALPADMGVNHPAETGVVLLHPEAARPAAIAADPAMLIAAGVFFDIRLQGPVARHLRGPERQAHEEEKKYHSQEGHLRRLRFSYRFPAGIWVFS